MSEGSGNNGRNSEITQSMEAKIAELNRRHPGLFESPEEYLTAIAAYESYKAVEPGLPFESFAVIRRANKETWDKYQEYERTGVSVPFLDFNRVVMVYPDTWNAVMQEYEATRVEDPSITLIDFLHTEGAARKARAEKIVDVGTLRESRFSPKQGEATHGGLRGMAEQILLRVGQRFGRQDKRS